MNIDVFFSGSHLTSPFTTPDRAKISIREKVASVAPHLLLGLFITGAGVIAFYLITAAIKAKKLNSKQSKPEKKIEKIKKQNFNEAVDIKGGKEPTDSISRQPVPITTVKGFEVESKVNLDIGMFNSSLFNSANPYTSLAKPQIFQCNPDYPISIGERRIPPQSLVDTVLIRPDDSCISAHGNGDKCYQDSEIVTLHEATEEVIFNDDSDKIYAHITTDNGKIVIQQQAIRGCTAAVAAMLIYDANKTIDLFNLKNTNLGKTESMTRCIEEAGLTPLVKKLTWEDDREESVFKYDEELTFTDGEDLIIKLQECIQKDGSAIVFTDKDIGSHVIVVDAVCHQSNSIRLRDPYHGWTISVTKEAFLRTFSPGEIIQLAGS